MADFKFPKDLNLEIQPYFMFSAFEWSSSRKSTQELRSIKTPIDTIILPLPTNGIVDNITHNWDEASGLTASGYLDVIQKNLINKAIDLTGDLGKYVQAEKGVMINDYASLAFGGTNFRSFDFTFNLTPKNASESKELQNLIKAFKKNSLPLYDDWKIYYPNFWNLKIVFPGGIDIIKVKNCVMNSIIVNHFPDTNLTTFKDGTPIKPELSLVFKELQKINRKEYE